jgi:EpsI family protein
LLVLLAGVLGRRVESAALRGPDFLRQLNLPFRGWTTSDSQLPARDRQVLEPDAVLVRRYSGQGQQAELAVIAGHRKKTVHTPGFCMAGGGWDTLWQHEAAITLPERQIPAIQMLMSQDRHQILVTYFFTDGDYCTSSLLQFQAVQTLKRFRARVPVGALVRIIVPLQSDEDAARALSADFARAMLPGVLDSLRHARIEVQ